MACSSLPDDVDALGSQEPWNPSWPGQSGLPAIIFGCSRIWARYARHVEPGLLQVDRIRSELRTQRIGRRIEYVESTSSTNDAAWKWIETIKADHADGLVVLAEHQSAGRGRMGRTWQAPRGAGLLCSVVVVDQADALTGGALALLASVAVCDAIEHCTGVAARIKWPNDLLVDGRKLAGILIESRVHKDGPSVWVLGIGVNCLQQRGHFAPELAEVATSLELLSTRAIDRTALAISVLDQLDRWLASPRTWDDAVLHDAWIARSETVGKRVVLTHAGRTFHGSVIDLDPAAALVVQLDEGGVRAFAAADTTLVRCDPMA